MQPVSDLTKVLQAETGCKPLGSRLYNSGDKCNRCRTGHERTCFTEIYIHALQTTNVCQFNLGPIFCTACVGACCSSAAVPLPSKTNWYAFLHGVRTVCRGPYHNHNASWSQPQPADIFEGAKRL